MCSCVCLGCISIWGGQSKWLLLVCACPYWSGSLLVLTLHWLRLLLYNLVCPPQGVIGGCSFEIMNGLLADIARQLTIESISVEVHCGVFVWRLVQTCMACTQNGIILAIFGNFHFSV